MPSRNDLEGIWKTLYTKTLPSKAKSRDSAQLRWPVALDHCFARIILDNVIGRGKEPWTKQLKAPAVKNMTESQLQACIELALQIECGDVDLVDLDQKSLLSRGTGEKKYKQHMASGKAGLKEGKRELSETMHREDSRVSATSPPKKKRQTSLPFLRVSAASSLPSPPPDHSDILQKIDSHPQLTDYRKRLYSTLMSVPRGSFTTYAALSDYLNSSARAVGNGMRNNPFAPDVPCHRVLASDHSIGGFGGSWGKDGKHADKKLELLRNEGVRFDGKGKALGQPYRDLKTLSSSTS
ncbi:MAG: hypothetical protein Q9227_001317 [Pyrenula ochraceoflavens]